MNSNVIIETVRKYVAVNMPSTDLADGSFMSRAIRAMSILSGPDFISSRSYRSFRQISDEDIRRALMTLLTKKLSLNSQRLPEKYYVQLRNLLNKQCPCFVDVIKGMFKAEIEKVLAAQQQEMQGESVSRKEMFDFFRMNRDSVGKIELSYDYSGKISKHVVSIGDCSYSPVGPDDGILTFKAEIHKQDGSSYTRTFTVNQNAQDLQVKVLPQDEE